MLIDRFPPFSENNMTIPIARRMVREWVRSEHQGAGLERVERDIEAFACWLAGSLLCEYVIRGQVKRCMISRWLMEALANVQAQPSQEA